MTDSRLGGAKQRAHSYAAAQWQDWGSELRGFAPEPMLFTAMWHAQREIASTVREANQGSVTALLTCTAYTLVQFLLVGRRDKEETEWINVLPLRPQTQWGLRSFYSYQLIKLVEMSSNNNVHDMLQVWFYCKCFLPLFSCGRTLQIMSFIATRFLRWPLFRTKWNLTYFTWQKICNGNEWSTLHSLNPICASE